MPDILRHFFDGLRSLWDSGRERVSETSPADVQSAFSRAAPWIVGTILFILIVYYPLGMLVFNEIDDDLDIAPAPQYTVAGGSQAVAIAATVTMREAERWIANKPFWHPSAPLDNTPSYQLGIMYAVSRFALELGDHLGRVRGSSAIDENVDRASSLLRYDGTVWYWGQGNIWPDAKAETQYKRGVEALLLYNRALAAGTATYERRADNLIVLLDRIASDLGSASAVIEARVATAGGHFDSAADDVFFNVKGKMYGYAVILNAVGQDFSTVIEDRRAGEIWTEMLTSMRTGAAMDPLIVINGAQDSTLSPSHLATLGFYLLRARTQLRELVDTLQK
ncbi:MAG: DUF2333 family protein [Rhodospirillaceae bacterium]